VEGIRSHSTNLSAGIDSPAEALRLGYDCGFSSIPGTFDPPLHSGFDFGSTAKITDIDALGNFVFVAFTSTSITDTDFAVFRVTDPAHPELLSTLNIGPGI